MSEQKENKRVEVVIVEPTKSTFSKYVVPTLCVVGALACGVIIGARCSQLVEDTLSEYL